MEQIDKGEAVEVHKLLYYVLTCSVVPANIDNLEHRLSDLRYCGQILASAEMTHVNLHMETRSDPIIFRTLTFTRYLNKALPTYIYLHCTTSIETKKHL